MLVSRFTSAEVLALDASGAVVARWRPARATRTDGLARAPMGELPPATVEMEPHVAWRMIPAPGGAWLLHQRARVEPIPDVPSDTSGPREMPSDPFDPSAMPAGPYGGGAGFAFDVERRGCSPSMLEVSVSYVDAHRPSGVLEPSRPIRIPLATDLSASPDGTRLLLGGPTPGSGTCAGNVTTVAVTDIADVAASEPERELADVQPITSVAFVDDSALVVFRRSPPMLVRYGGASTDMVVLESHGRVPRGAELFDFVTRSGLSCASCHPEGGDDGHRWTFADGPPLRTQTLRGGIMETVPFHWAGDVPSFGALIAEGFVRRMAGPVLDVADVSALEGWLDALPAPARPRTDPAAVARGRVVFESPEAECSTCHAGPAYTTSVSRDVGTGGAFQVALLVGVAYRAPYMHDGCAPSLRDVVAGDPACRGAAHGETGHLSPAEVDDLVTYLRSL